MSQPLISIKNVHAAYSGNVVLNNVTLDVTPEDFTGVIGPNGGGKTTLLKIILGLLKPQKGTVERNIGKHDIGYLPQVSQFDDQFPITVENVVLSGLSTGMNIRRKKTSETIAKVEKILEATGISDFKHRPIGKLSGGELQRTMLARAIISSPKLLILDEPDPGRTE